ncbi:MAG: hydrogenase iron-sulfur subunit [Pseudomonadota bacterium]
MSATATKPPVLILASEACAYPGANSVGQAHQAYADNTYIMRVPSPAVFPPRFYLDCLDQGFAGIIIMSCGVECPYEGAYPALARRVDEAFQLMKARGLDLRRLRLTAICTVCNRSFLNEVKQMTGLTAELGPAQDNETVRAA